MSKETMRLPDPAIDGPWRADSYGAKVIPARNGAGFEELKFFEKTSMAIYGRFDDRNLRAMLRHILSWVDRQKDNLNYLILDRFNLVDFTKSHLESYKSDRVELITALQLLIDYAKRYEALLIKSGISFSPNGQYLVAVIPVKAEELVEAEVRSLLIELIELTNRTSVRPILVTENAKHMPEELQQDFDWQAFIGSDQIRYGRDRYRMEIIPGIATRVAVGVSFDRATDSIRVLNGLSYEPTEESLELKRAVVEDSENYKKFLEGLADGS